LADLTSEIQGTINIAHFVMNPAKNFVWMSITARQDVTSQVSASMNYFFEPDYLIRTYRDVNTREWRPCTFDLRQWSARVSYRPVKVLEVVGMGRLKDYVYNEYFTEYDGRSEVAGLEGIVRIARWRAAAGWAYTDFANTGFDLRSRLPQDVTLEDTEVGEADYQEDEFSGSVRYGFRLLARRAYAEAGGSVGRRYYATSRSPEADPFHHGRRDLTADLEMTFSIDLTRRVTFKLFADRASRDTRAAVPLVPALKDYRRWGVGSEIGVELR
jgi:hypothetical protein